MRPRPVRLTRPGIRRAASSEGSRLSVSGGDLVGERYTLLSEIGAGGNAVIWLAVDERLQREVAVKFLHTEGALAPSEPVRNFLREARLAASVHHRNVVQVLDFGTHLSQLPFMVMEHLRGATLHDHFHASRALTTSHFVGIISHALEGLKAIHWAGIVHRDIKPENIFISHGLSGAMPKLIDFGISIPTEPGSTVAGNEGKVTGTPAYMSPEQARGVSDLDGRADIYSMGVVLYEGLTGRVPFEAQDPVDLLIQVVTEEPPPMHEVAPDVSDALCELVHRAMAHSRDERYRDASEMQAALGAAMADRRVKTRPVRVSVRALRR